MKITFKLSACFLLFMSSYSFGQVDLYNYKRELTGINEQWHRIVLPNDLFSKVNNNLSDIRIFGISEQNDTVETPYLLSVKTEQSIKKEVAFKTINASYNFNGHYFTFEIPTAESINQIKLEFNQQNFDWRIDLEGSHNQNQWFTIVENYRILSIKNDLTNFNFTQLNFANSKYRFFRTHINCKEKPALEVASISQNDIIAGVVRNYAIQSLKIAENKASKQTEIDVALPTTVPVSSLKININSAFDYYRAVSIMYVTDSFKTERGWKYNYATLTSGTLHSLEPTEFKFNSVLLKNLKIIIHNQDNPSLTIHSINIAGHVHELVARFTKPANYFLVYGNKNSNKANYDIDRFADNIPKNCSALKLGAEQKMAKEIVQTKAPLFANKNWLWAVMTLLIVLLGWFSLKMMRKA